MYTVLKKLETGEFVHVATRDGLQQALQLAQSLNIHWPGEYEVRDSHSAVIRLALSPNSDVQRHLPA
jgi:hypothetical protein